jgi:hypothetical protein
MRSAVLGQAQGAVIGLVQPKAEAAEDDSPA